MGYSKAETEKKQRKLVSKTQRTTRKVLVILFKVILVGIIAVIIAGAGAGFGMMKGILDNAPDTSSINIVPQGYRSNIRSQDGSVEKEISTIDSNRVYVYYDQIPKDMVNAFVAIEDQRFWTHNGIDVRGIFRAFAKGAASGHFNEGASTLTQQLIKNQVFNVGLDETTFMDKLERKIQEQYLAIELEKQYTKEQIVEYYLNTIYLGRGVSGVQAASEKYFGKDMTELTISEIAVIAGIPQNPSRYDPVANPDENKKRRAEVLKKMLDQEYITQQQYDEAVADDVYARIDAEHEVQLAESDVNTFYQDAIINGVIEKFMDMYGCTKSEAENKLYTGGYEIYSAQDKAIQKICDDVINNPEYVSNSTKVGLSYKLTLLGADKETNYNYSIGDLTNYFAEQTGNSKYNNIYPSEQDARAAADTFKEAMLEETGGTYVAEAFSVSPQPQFSFTIMDQHTGYVKALVGGRGTKTVNRAFNRATEAERQPGSTFKIVAAYAPLIDSGKAGLATSFNDEPYQYANGNEVRNAGGGHSGYCTIRKSIASSINVCAVKAITEETPEAAFEYLLKFGYTTLVDQEVDSNGTLLTDKTQACALGGLSYGVTNYEMTAAYASIANGGVYNQPVLFTKIIDHDGNVVVDNTTPTSHEVIKPTTAWQLIEAMKSVVTSGTGTPARLQSGMTCAGKTGTTSENYDLWFCGMTPYYTASIWMGYDSNVDMGGQNTHKYMWRDIMDQIVELEGQDTSADFERPEGITTISVCEITGLLPGEGCPTSSDYYAQADIPSQRCSGHEALEFCTESHKLANSGCPETVSFTVEIDENGNKKLVGSNGESTDGYTYTDEVCDIHTPLEEGEIELASSAGEGGTISPTVRVAKGANVTFYITPHNGYRTKDVIVNGQSQGAVSSFTFNDVQANGTISVTFEKTGGTDPAPTPTTQPPAPTTQQPPTTQAPTTQQPTTQQPEPTTQAPEPQT